MSSEEPKLRVPRHLRLVDDVRQSLEEAILSGQMRPGEHLAESPIGEQLGVSRTTVREALLMLEQQGLVVSVPRRGTFVTRLSAQDAQDLSYLRILLEGFALIVGHRRIDATLLAGLEDCIAQMRACDLPEEIPHLIQIDLDFHGQLMELAGSSRFKEVWTGLNGQLGALILRGIESHRFTTADVADLHQELLNALRTRDPDQMLAGLVDHYSPTDGAHAERYRQLSNLIKAAVDSYGVETQR